MPLPKRDWNCFAGHPFGYSGSVGLGNATLAVVSPQDLIKEGAEAVAGKLPLAADIAVDEAMMKAQGPEWLNSDDRKTLLDHIARSKATEYESWLIERHLDLVS